MPLYIETESNVAATPTRNQGEGQSPKSGAAPRTVSATDRALAKFFWMLSAYLTTMPTTRPPCIGFEF